MGFLENTIKRAIDSTSYKASSAMSGIVDDAFIRPARKAATDSIKGAFSNWHCTCGTSNSGNFCQSCGKSKDEANGNIKCSKCGAAVKGSTSAKFCTNCGNEF